MEFNTPKPYVFTRRDGTEQKVFVTLKRNEFDNLIKWLAMKAVKSKRGLSTGGSGCVEVETAEAFLVRTGQKEAATQK